MSNRLQYEISPYLRMHADNPIDWYPWSDDAFLRAQRENKPVFLSVGYSACHWCHVMARESFSDATVAEILNKYFISIKVDREERPDVDAAYMNMAASLGSEGGWPLNMFLTPWKKPFFAGTYFPRDDKAWHTGFRSLLLAVHDAWASRGERLSESASRLTEMMCKRRRALAPITDETVMGAVKKLVSVRDKEFGGFGDAPKFPMAPSLSFLLETKDNEASEMAQEALLAIYKGGIHDHIGGGYFRYATDREWQIPHFEKMTAENALLTCAFADAYDAAEKPLFMSAAKECADFLLRTMRTDGGGFYTSLSSESAGCEGAFYLWTKKEAEMALGERAQEFCEYYGINDAPNFRGKCVPRISEQVIINRFDAEIETLRAVRDARKKPPVDEKILTGASALCALALWRVYEISSIEKYRTAARETVDFIERELCRKNRLIAGLNMRGIGAFLPDYAYFVWAMAKMGDGRAEKYADTALMLFSDKDGALNFTAADAESMIVPLREGYDGALPSGAAAMALALVTIGGAKYTSAAEKILESLGGECNLMSANHATLLRAYLASQSK